MSPLRSSAQRRSRRSLRGMRSSGDRHGSDRTGRSELARIEQASAPPSAEEQGSRSDHSRRWVPTGGAGCASGEDQERTFTTARTRFGLSAVLQPALRTRTVRLPAGARGREPRDDPQLPAEGRIRRLFWPPAQAAMTALIVIGTARSSPLTLDRALGVAGAVRRQCRSAAGEVRECANGRR
jgi:hypothetical protein